MAGTNIGNDKNIGSDNDSFKFSCWDATKILTFSMYAIHIPKIEYIAIPRT